MSFKVHVLSIQSKFCKLFQKASISCHLMHHKLELGRNHMTGHDFSGFFTSMVCFFYPYLCTHFNYIL